jgi:Tol biopolymer transport system component
MGEYEYWDQGVLDVTTSGPLTVLYYTEIARRNPLTFVDVGLFAVHLNDVGGVLAPDPGPPARLTLPENMGFPGVNPNTARRGSFSPVRDRLALVATNNASSVLMTAKVDRDESSGKVKGLSDLLMVGDLYSLGLPDPTFPNSKGFTGDIAYSPDGSSIVASIYYDLWLVHLSADNSIAGTDLLTANTDGFAEWKPSYSPEGTRVAYTAGGVMASTGGVRDTDIYSLTLDTRAVTRVTGNKNKGDAGSSRNNAIWSSDGTWIGFSAYSSTRTPRNSPCSALVNSEIFLIRADGSNTASAITDTNGTSVEAWPKWGWVPR